MFIKKMNVFVGPECFKYLIHDDMNVEVKLSWKERGITGEEEVEVGYR